MKGGKARPSRSIKKISGKLPEILQGAFSIPRQKVHSSVRRSNSYSGGSLRWSSTARSTASIIRIRGRLSGFTSQSWKAEFLLTGRKYFSSNTLLYMPERKLISNRWV